MILTEIISFVTFCFYILRLPLKSQEVEEPGKRNKVHKIMRARLEGIMTQENSKDGETKITEEVTKEKEKDGRLPSIRDLQRKETKKQLEKVTRTRPQTEIRCEPEITTGRKT